MANTSSAKSSNSERSVDKTSLTAESSLETAEVAPTDPATTVRDESRELDSASHHSDTSSCPTVDDKASIERNSDDSIRNPALSDDDEVSQILQRDVTIDAEVPETVDEVGGVITEVIMSKTFTESIAPDREFVPISEEGDVVHTGQITESDTSTRTVPRGPNEMTTFLSAIDQKANELVLSDHEVRTTSSTVPDSNSAINETSASKVSTEDDTTTTGAVVSVARDDEDTGRVVGIASRQVRDLAGEFYRLQELLDNLTNPCRLDIRDEEFSSSDESADIVGVDQEGDVNDLLTSEGDRKLKEQARVVYRYRIHTAPSQTGRRWIRRTRSESEEESTQMTNINVLGDVVSGDVQIVDDVSTTSHVAVPDVSETYVNALNS